MLEIETNKGMFIGYVNLYNYMLENNINEINIINIKFSSEHLEFLRDNARDLFKSLFQDLRTYTIEEIKDIVL
ncbi:hypothetical protein [Clostridium beijerinckii]|uniref:hypothetical protein n=1 Tax=Clostridium beijerinckii TaxID=1520 RepID=UPI00098CE84D|nr:hypothetical protein [Clostridium beijerinckii]MBA8935775.1 protoheme ferro-lyase [Clostridium beijerinckii]NRU40169.1 protoheme ferro-lyase [Clostridium beijerinckii]NSA96553.1 protoheme ferro-lyase [Clostridium beijerinckii]OOM63730.1 hypothetical protein CLOBI_18610 [Clostridium beijerinckii]OOM70370.1 hypothetical protein CLBEIC_20340 [Clostridium beijerinckii]